MERYNKFLKEIIRIQDELSSCNENLELFYEKDTKLTIEQLNKIKNILWVLDFTSTQLLQLQKITLK